MTASASLLVAGLMAIPLIDASDTSSTPEPKCSVGQFRALDFGREPSIVPRTSGSQLGQHPSRWINGDCVVTDSSTGEQDSTDTPLLFDDRGSGPWPDGEVAGAAGRLDLGGGRQTASFALTVSGSRDGNVTRNQVGWTPRHGRMMLPTFELPTYGGDSWRSSREGVDFRVAATPPNLVSVQVQPRRDFRRSDAFVAATQAFSFFSDPRVNFHDFLIWRIRSDTAVDPRPECVSGLSTDRSDALRSASEFYQRHLIGDGRRGDDHLLDLRFHLVGFPEVEIGADSVVEAAVGHLEAALSAYRECWWPDHDARNRRWIADAVSRVIPHEPSITARLSRYYEGDWDLPIPVDVAGYAGRTRANTIRNPDHILISGAENTFPGYTGLEMLFHEASHTLVTPRFGAVARAIAEASSNLGRDRPPDDLWHVLLFYTTGWTIEHVLGEHGVEYVQFLYSDGLFQRAWPELQKPVEEYWGDYLNGDIDMEQAARRIIQSGSEQSTPGNAK